MTERPKNEIEIEECGSTDGEGHVCRMAAIPHSYHFTCRADDPATWPNYDFVEPTSASRGSVTRQLLDIAKRAQD